MALDDGLQKPEIVKLPKVEVEHLKTVIGGILEEADRMIKESGEYKDLFEYRSSVPGLVSRIEDKFEMIVLSAVDIIKEKTGKMTNEAYEFLYAIPLLSLVLEKKIKEKDGYSCVVDKTHYLMAKELERLLNLKKEKA